MDMVEVEQLLVVVVVLLEIEGKVGDLKRVI